MKRTLSTTLLVVITAVLLVGFYTIDFNSEKASVFSLPKLEGTTDVPASQDQPLNSLKDFNDAIVKIAEETNPTVVMITTTQQIERPENPLFRFFDFPGAPQGPQTRQGLGSGVIVSSDGYILTNNHVVEGAESIFVSLYNDEEVSATVVGTDPQTDIAVLKIDKSDLPAVKFGNSDNLRVGEMVLAIGSPMSQNFAHTVSMGIVSAKGRALRLANYESYIQTDAAINPGNSGGALINLDGELVGINTAIASQSGGYQGIGFAIPANLAQNIMKSLIEDGEVERGYLGIYYGGTVDKTMARALGLQNAGGFIISQVEDDGPADDAGLKADDVIVSLNGEPVGNWDDFRYKIANMKPGSDISLGIMRDGEKMTVDVTLGELDRDQQTASRQDTQDMSDRLGFDVQNLTPNLAAQLGLERGTTGVVVTQVNPGSNAYRQGLRKGDVVTQVDRQNVSDIRDFSSLIRGAMDDDDNVVLLKIIREGTTQYIAFEL